MEVVSASQGAFGPLLGKLTALLADECGRLKGVRREIRFLRSELTSMHAALKEYTKLEDPNEQVKAWISLVRELAYDTEDVFDKFVHHLGDGNGGADHGSFKEFFRKTARRLKTLGSRRRVADQIDDLKARIKQVKELKSSYKLDDAPLSSNSGHAAVDPRLCALFAEEAHLVGIDGPRDNLAKWMVDEEHCSTKHRKVLSIVGFGGLGKTTLANEVYRKMQGHFHCRAIVSVSQKPDIKKIIKDVIQKVPYPDGFTRDMDFWDEMTSITKLRELLQHKRYLVIVDDIWSISVWNTIKCAFPENHCSSRIIITTRIIDVARLCCLGFDGHVYEMEVLSDLHSRSLFFKRIFGSEDCCPDMLKEVSNKILKKCGGLPLAIISISGLLANRSVVKEEWEKVKRSIGSALENERSLEGMSSILSLSYNDLPPHLKTCLLYLSVFPEDYIIDRDILVRRWIAEGFISEEYGQSQQDVAENYFYELINKSMVQPVDIGYDGKARACRVHDLLLELIISKSAEDNFVTVIGGGQTGLKKCNGYIRRLSIQHMDQDLASALANEDLSHVRSLTVTTSDCIKHLASLVEFEALRVLDLVDDPEVLDEYFMNGVDKLFQLKFLRVRGMSSLPPGIVMLRDLETLDLRGTSIEELPAGIVRLVKLQYLLLPKLPFSKVLDGIGNMRSLRVISGFNITKGSNDAVEELGSLTNLNELDIQFLRGGSDEHKRHEEMLLSSLCKLGSRKLQSLRIESDGSLEFLHSWSPPLFSLQIFDMDSDYYFTNIPKWINAPELTSLAFLNINLTELREEGLHTLGELPALLCLRLRLYKRSKDSLTVQGTEFASLKEFDMFGDGGANVTFVKGAMPKLEKLSLPFSVSVGKTYDFYLGIEHLSCLKEVGISFDKEGATDSEIGAASIAIRKEVAAHPNHPTYTSDARAEEFIARFREQLRMQPVEQIIRMLQQVEPGKR